MMLQNISENLKPGGFFVGTIPNACRIVWVSNLKDKTYIWILITNSIIFVFTNFHFPLFCYANWLNFIHYLICYYVDEWFEPLAVKSTVILFFVLSLNVKNLMLSLEPRTSFNWNKSLTVPSFWFILELWKSKFGFKFKVLYHNS